MKPSAFYDLPARCFPFTIEIRDHSTGELLDEINVSAPGGAEIPGYAPRRVDVIVRFADGTMSDSRKSER